MHDADAPAWREIVEKSHARLLEELAAAVESDRRNAVDTAVAAEREIARAERDVARAELAAAREKANAEFTALRESAKVEIDSLRESSGAEIQRLRETSNAEIQSLRETVSAQAKGLRENADEIKALRESLSSERERAAAEIQNLRESTSAEAQALRESTTAEAKALLESLSAEKSGRQKAEEQLAAETERAAKLLASERERASTELKSTRERASADLKQERERGSADLNSARERASADLNKVRAELTEAGARSKEAARQAMAEALNQSLRRIRQATSVESTLQLAAELSSSYAHKAVVLVFENNQARIAASRSAVASPAGVVRPTEVGVSAAVTNASPVSAAVNGASSDRPAEAFDLTLENAPALASAIETRDPVTVLARESEISPALARLLDAAPAEKVYLFPLVARQQVVAMLVVAGEVFAAAPELLAEAAGMRLESITETVKKTPSPETLVTIQRAAIPASATPDRWGWEELNAEDQQLHLQAQRVARVRVAKMRLEREDAWRRGLAQSDVYGALRRDIESARTEFLQTFLSKSSTMVDYLHLEILRSLANDDDRVLGREYPGPMV